MKIITICRINVTSVIKSTIVPFIVIGLIAGFILGLLLTPANLGAKTLVQGLIKTMLLMGVYGVFISIILTLASVLYNLIFRFTGGLEVKIEERGKA